MSEGKINVQTLIIAVIVSVALSVGAISIMKDGFVGLAGEQGIQGVQGLQGEQGVQGIQGESIIGSQGEQGVRGDRGLQGFKGEAGVSGEDSTLEIEKMSVWQTMYTDRDSMFDMSHLGSASFQFGSSSLVGEPIDGYEGAFYIKSEGPVFGIYWFADYSDESGSSFSFEVIDADRSSAYTTYTVASMVYNNSPEDDSGMMYIFGEGLYKVKINSQRGRDWLVQIISYGGGGTCSKSQPSDWPWGVS